MTNQSNASSWYVRFYVSNFKSQAWLFMHFTNKYTSAYLLIHACVREPLCVCVYLGVLLCAYVCVYIVCYNGTSVGLLLRTKLLSQSPERLTCERLHSTLQKESSCCYKSTNTKAELLFSNIYNIVIKWRTLSNYYFLSRLFFILTLVAFHRNYTGRHSTIFSNQRKSEMKNKQQ